MGSPQVIDEENLLLKMSICKYILLQKELYNFESFYAFFSGHTQCFRSVTGV
jgi:hypothetical protein